MSEEKAKYRIVSADDWNTALRIEPDGTYTVLYEHHDYELALEAIIKDANLTFDTVEASEEDYERLQNEGSWGGELDKYAKD